MKRPSARVPWSHGDKFLMIVLGLTAVLVTGLGLWLHELGANPVVQVLTPIMPAVNADTFYKAAGAALVESRKIRRMDDSGSATDAPPLTQVQEAALVQENLMPIEILHQGFKYPYREPSFRSVAPFFPHNSSYRDLAVLLTLQAEVKAQKSDWNGAIQADLDAVQLGEEMPHGTPLIGWAIGVACQRTGRWHVWQVIDHLKAVDAGAAAQRLERIRADHVPFANALQEQEWDDQAGLMTMMRERDWPGNFLAATSAFLDSDLDTPDRWAALRIRLAGKRRIMENYTNYAEQGIANARQPYAMQAADPPVPNDPVSHTLLMGYSSFRLSEARSNTQNALLLTALALHAYELDHSKYPAKLAALAPDYLQAVSDDPFALSGPLRYKRVGPKYLLYSVGPDSKDDGGRAIFDRNQPAPHAADASDSRYRVQENSQGDIVAGVNIN